MKNISPVTGLVLAAVAMFVTLFFAISYTSAMTLDYIRMPEPLMISPDLGKMIGALNKEIWLYNLEQCESGGDELAVNEKDTDGTPSYGILQFKPGTFYYFSEKYGFEHEVDYMLAGRQVAIVRRMMDDPSVKWRNQFPGCVRKIGMPPVNPGQ